MKVILCILDGVGLREEIHGNAFKKANTPFIDSLFRKYPNSKLNASEEHVGLLKGIMGNSEVGHMNIGAGKVVYQPSQFINEEIKNNKFNKNKALNDLMDKTKEKDTSLHLLGLVSDAGVHSLFSHLYAILDLAKEKGIKKLYIHGFSDGRDTSPTSGIDFFTKLSKKLQDINLGTIATISGRYYAMDRDNRWDRIESSYKAMVDGIGNTAIDYKDVFKQSYKNNITDEFIKPTIIDKNGLIKDGDSVIAFNFRPDRLREIFTVLTNPKFKEFNRTKVNLDVVTLMPVSKDVKCKNAFKNQEVNMPLGVYLSKNKKSQLRIAETEKYAHVTYFFDGGIERKLKKCTRILIPSPKVATYDMSPKMSSQKITTTLLKELDKDIHDVIILNYANGDMLGHTGNIKATIESLEYLDKCIQRLHDCAIKKGYTLIVTADHGNCEYMLDDKNKPITSHTLSLVPFIICDNKYKLKDGSLCDISPTILKIMKLKKPRSMTGKSLIV